MEEPLNNNTERVLDAVIYLLSFAIKVGRSGYTVLLTYGYESSTRKKLAV